MVMGEIVILPLSQKPAKTGSKANKISLWLKTRVPMQNVNIWG